MRFAAMICLLLAVSVRAQDVQPDPLGYERVLLPVAIATDQPRPGANGSRWLTELTGFNAAAEPVQVFQSYGTYFCTGVLITCGLGRPVPPWTSFTIRPELDGRNIRNVGIYLYVSRMHAASVHFQLRVRNTSGSSVGTEIPVIRSSELLSRPVELLNIPFDENLRHAVRIYGVTSDDHTADVLVQITPENGGATERILQLVKPPKQLPRDEQFPHYPAYAELTNLVEEFPLLRDASSARVTIVPLSPGLRFWAFVSITNNETHEVTIVTPQ